MTPSKRIPDNDLNNGYGYLDFRLNNLDSLADKWSSKSGQRWGRLKEVKIDMRGVSKTPAPATPSKGGMTPADAAFFTRGARIGFQCIARRHNLGPTEMWAKVSDALLLVGMHRDDLQDVEDFIFGWTELSAEMLERYRWRYPDRCPLLDALCTLDSNCDELNEVQDWILHIKGSKKSQAS
jgi:hypothetical protein